MRAALLVGSLSWLHLCSAQGYHRRYDFDGQGWAQTAFGIERTADGYAVISATDQWDSIAPGTFFEHSSILIMSIEEDGTSQWTVTKWRAHHGVFPGWANCCDTVPGGGFIVGGSSEDTAAQHEIYLMRFNAQGDTLWTRVFGGAGQYWIGRQVRRTSDGGFLIVGDTDADGSEDGFALKTDSAGNEEWRHTYGWSMVQGDGLIAVDKAPGTDLYMSGSRFVSDIDGELWLQRTTSQGEVIWRVSWGGPYKEGGAQVISLSDGQPLVASGIGHAPNYTAMRPYLAKLDSSDGSIIWEHEYGPIANATLFFAGKERFDHSLIACGTAHVPGGENGLLLRTTSEGDSLWMRTYAYEDSLVSGGRGRFYDVLPTSDGGFIAAGSTYPLAPYSQDTWVVKVDSLGCIVPGCQLLDAATEIVTNLKDALLLYPNPVRDALHVGIKLPANFKTEGPLVISVTSQEGKLVRQHELPTSGAFSPSPSEKGPGDEGAFSIDVGALAAGTYSLHLSDAHRWIAGKQFVVE